MKYFRIPTTINPIQAPLQKTLSIVLSQPYPSLILDLAQCLQINVIADENFQQLIFCIFDDNFCIDAENFCEIARYLWRSSEEKEPCIV